VTTQPPLPRRALVLSPLPRSPLPRRALFLSPLPRRALLAGAGALALAACTETEPEAEPQPSGPEPVDEVGAPVPSPSGEFAAVIDAAGDALGVLLRDSEGTDFWADDYPYEPAHPPSVLWQTDADVLWVLSEELGTARIRQDSEGGWSKEAAEELDEEIPEEIAYWL